MNGEGIIPVWALVSVIFLMKIPSVREFFAKVRKMSAIGIICMGLSLGFLANVSYTKDGVNTNQSTSQSVSLSAENSSISTQSSISTRTGLPDFWKDDPTDTDGDGIPDLWEKWTHGKKLVADSDLDRDGDGLSDLEEFQNQTDPRTADTDGDSFSDAFEVANNMNPVVSEDFTPVEPDTNNNGVPDIWEQIGYSGSFHDANGNGFDDTYEQTILPVASDSNFDVFVDVYTTRSATLNWTIGEDRISILMLPTAGTSVKIRLPFGTDTELYLQSSPYGTDLPSGELWKSRMRISFAPRTGQTAIGTCIIAANGDISQQVVEQATVITRFSDPIASKQMRSLDSGDGEWPKIEMLRRRYSLIPDADVYHGSGNIVGPFDIVNTVNIDEDSVHWSVDYGTMDSATGFSSSLTVTAIPPNDEPIIVTATVQLDERFAIIRTAPVNRCPQHTFSLDSCTANFAPLPGSNAVFSVTLPGCTHQNEPGWLEAEIVRELLGSTQHVAYVDMDVSTSSVDRYGNTVDIPNQSTFAWDGIAQASLSQGDYVEEFTQGSLPFHRAAPEVAAGKPVPPPYVTLVVRLWNPGKSEVLAEARLRIYVPQVVQVKWQSDADTLFRTPINHQALGQTVIVYSADYVGDPDALMQDTLQRLRAYYPASVNILFVPFFSSDVETTKFLVITSELQKTITGDHIEAYQYGLTLSPPMLQRSANGVANCFLGSISDKTFNLYKKFSEDSMSPQPFAIPISSSQMLEAICKVSAHEVGHTLGLVDTTYLGGVGNKHNPGSEDQSKMMNVNTDLRWLFKQHPPVGWRTLNSQYLEFVLPVPK